MGIRLVSGLVCFIVSGLGLLSHKAGPVATVIFSIVLAVLYLIFMVWRKSITNAVLFLLVLSNFFTQLTGGTSSYLFWLNFLMFALVMVRDQSLETGRWLVLCLLSYLTSSLIKGSGSPWPILPLTIFALLGFIFLKKNSGILQRLRADLSYFEAKDYYLTSRRPERARIVATVNEIDKYPQTERPMLFFLKFLHQSFNAYTSCIFGYTTDKTGHEKELAIVAAFSDSDNFIDKARMRIGEGLVGMVAKERKEILIREYYEDPDRLGYYAGETKIKSVIGAPVIFGKDLEGVIVLDRKDEPFREEDRELVRIATVTFAHLLGMLRSYEKKRYEAAYFSSLYELIKQMQKELTLDKILEITLDSAQEVVGCDAAAAARVDIDTHEGTIIAARSNAKCGLENKIGHRFRLDEGLVGWVANMGSYLLKDDVRQGRSHRYSRSEGTHPFHSFLGVPIKDENQVIGVIWAESRMRKRFVEEDAEFMNFLSAQLSLAWVRANLYQQVKELSIRDSLTALYNHRQFQEILKEAMTRHKELSLLLLDVDHFKGINDRFGHPVGDEVLKTIAKMIDDAPGEAARYGGEEFALVLPGYSLKKAAPVAVKIRDRLRKHKFRFNDQEFTVTLSVGISHFPKDAGKRGELIEKADNALYSAKKMGRDRVVLAFTSRVVH